MVQDNGEKSGGEGEVTPDEPTAADVPLPRAASERQGSPALEPTGPTTLAPGLRPAQHAGAPGQAAPGGATGQPAVNGRGSAAPGALPSIAASTAAAAEARGAGEEDLPELTLGDAEEEKKPVEPGAARVAFEATAEVPVTGPGMPIEQVLRSVPPAPVQPPPAAPEPLKIAPGGRLGRYQLLEQIGEGGMATIFRARDVQGGRIVAVKALHAHQAQTLAGRRFQREFRAIHRISHPHIVQVFDYAVEQNQPYIVMEYVQGHDLKTHLKHLRALPTEERWRQVEDLMRQVLEALEFIHARGIIHRDLKPSNILLTPEGRTKLTDFGVAKPQDASVQLTQAGMLVGTLAYLAPEVFEQKKVDHRVDLYALGVMLYVMLTDKLPFSGKNIAQIMQKHLKHEAEPPRAVNPAVPEHLERITMRLLAKDRTARFPSAAEVLRALETQREDAEAALIEQQSTEHSWVPRLVGRTDALLSLRDTLLQLSRGKGGVVVVEGTEGIGKSRLVETGLSLAQPQGITVAYGRCISGGIGEWGEGFRGVVHAIAAEVERTGEAADGLPRLIERFGTQDAPVPSLQPEIGPEGLEDQLCALFTSLTRTSPRIIWLDDLDQADPGTLGAVTMLGRNLVRTGAPLLIVATLRLASGPMSPFLKRILTGESTGVRPRQVGLGPLGRNDVLELVESMFPRDARGPVLATRLHQEAAGNPLVVVELIRLLVARGRMGRRVIEGERRWVMALSADEIGQQLTLPKGLPALLQTRLTAYPTQTRTLLRLIAVWGREVRFKTLLRLASASEDAVLAHLDRLVADGWLAEDWLGGDDRYVIAHPAYRAVLMSELTPGDVARLRGFIDLRLGLKREGSG